MKEKPKTKLSAYIWIIAIVGGLIWAYSTYENNKNEQALQQNTQAAQSAERCTSSNFANSNDPVAIPGQQALIRAQHPVIGQSNDGEDGKIAMDSYNAWKANGCD